MKKIGIIRCMQTEDICPGTTDFSFAAQGKGAFEELGPCEVIGFATRVIELFCKVNNKTEIVFNKNIFSVFVAVGFSFNQVGFFGR